MPSSGYVADTFVAGEQPTTAKWNELWGNDASFNSGNGFNDNIIITRHFATSGLQLPDKTLNPYKFSVYRNASLTYPGSASTAIVFDTVTYDTGSNYSNSTGKFTAPVAGFYFFKASLGYQWTSSVGRALGVGFMVNGTSVDATVHIYNYSSNYNFWSESHSTFQKLSANDTVFVVDSGGTSLGCNTGASSTNFQGFLVSAT